MNGNFELAMQLLAVGMLTVFAILFLVVFIGNMIVKFVNKFVPEVEKVVAPPKTNSNNTIDAVKMAVITSAVQSITAGKGKVVKVEKI